MRLVWEAIPLRRKFPASRELWYEFVRVPSIHKHYWILKSHLEGSLAACPKSCIIHDVSNTISNKPYPNRDMAVSEKETPPAPLLPTYYFRGMSRMEVVIRYLSQITLVCLQPN